MIEVKCKYCGVVFNVYPYRLKKDGLCCSRECLGRITTKNFVGNPININSAKLKIEFYYLIGLICSDGYIHIGEYSRKGRNKKSEKRYIRITLHLSDKDIL